MHIARLNIELSKALTGKEKVIGLKVYKFACELIQGLFKGERTRLQIFEEMEKVTTLKTVSYTHLTLPTTSRV